MRKSMLTSGEGTIVYARDTHRKGVIKSFNSASNMVTVKWDDGRHLQMTHLSNLMSEELYRQIKQDERIKDMTLKPEQCIIDAVVYLVAKEPPLRRGKIAGPLNNTHGNNLVIIEWDGGTLSKHQITTLLTEEEGKKEDLRLKEEKTRLEQEFTKVETECESKLKQAAKLIDEAAVLANTKGLDLQEMYDAAKPLERAMERAGWNTSSWHC